jgi:hypothetical protein
MSGVFQNIDPPPPSPPGRTHLLGGEGVGGGSIFWKTPDTALYSTVYIHKYFVRGLTRVI